jgi:hypothetical protein
LSDQNKKSEVTADLVAAFFDRGGSITKCKPGKWNKELAIAKNFRRTYRPRKSKKHSEIEFIKSPISISQAQYAILNTSIGEDYMKTTTTTTKTVALSL